MSPAAWVTKLATVSSLLPRTTAMRSRRSAEAFSTLARRACWTVRVSLSHTITATSSSCSSTAKASSYPSASATGTAFTWAAPLSSTSRISSVSSSVSPKAAAASSYRVKVYRVPAVPSSHRAAMPTVCPPPLPLTTAEASYWEYTPGRSWVVMLIACSLLSR